MNNELFDALEILERDRGISKAYMLEKLEAALVSAFKKERGGTNARVFIDCEKKDVHLYEQKTVVETVENPATEISLEEARTRSKRIEVGDVLETELKPKTFGRISAHAAKQVIIQAIHEAERGLIAKEYESKQDEIITVTVERVDPVTGNAYVNIGTDRATLLKSEMLPTDDPKPDDRIRVLISGVNKEGKGPLITLSRTRPNVIRRLFELEVPELKDGVVEIHNIIREPGSRSKMSVSSKDEGVDPIGSCIGKNGMRIDPIVNELGGEHIDVVKFSEDPAEYISAALAPATVKEVRLIDGERAARIIVDPEQLSLAIGKEGQNARLAAKLTGYKIDIKTK